MSATGTALTEAPIHSLVSVNGDLQGFVTMKVGNQLVGISVLMVQDVLRFLEVSSIPLAPKEIAGSMNLRGRIVTVVDMRARLGLETNDKTQKMMHAVVEYNDELFSLMVDSVGDVMNLPLARVEKTPVNLETNWKEVAAGVCRLEKELLVILDVQSLLTF